MLIALCVCVRARARRARWQNASWLATSVFASGGVNRGKAGVKCVRVALKAVQMSSIGGILFWLRVALKDDWESCWRRRSASETSRDVGSCNVKWWSFANNASFNACGTADVYGDMPHRPVKSLKSIVTLTNPNHTDLICCFQFLLILQELALLAYSFRLRWASQMFVKEAVLGCWNFHNKL